MIKKVVWAGIVLFLCFFFIYLTAIVLERKVYDSAFSNGYLTGQIDLAKKIASAGATINASQIDENCQNFLNIKDISLYVCAKSGHKIIAVNE